MSMTWGEIDRQAGVWTVPADRIKAGKEHRVPLVPSALALVGKAGKHDELVAKGGLYTRLHRTQFGIAGGYAAASPGEASQEAVVVAGK